MAVDLCTLSVRLWICSWGIREDTNLKKSGHGLQTTDEREINAILKGRHGD